MPRVIVQDVDNCSDICMTSPHSESLGLEFRQFLEALVRDQAVLEDGSLEQLDDIGRSLSPLAFPFLDSPLGDAVSRGEGI